MKHLILNGLPGSGKTTVGRLAAERLGLPFSDCDTLIEVETGLTIPVIFAQQGESGFRAVESRILAALLREDTRVIATGGGVVESAENRRLLKESVNELLEGAPASMDIDELKRNLRRTVPEVRNVHHVHVWLVGEKPVMTLHVQVIPPHDHDALLDRIQHFLEHHYDISHATVQMESQPCSGPDCHLNEAQSGHSHHHDH